MLLLLLFCLFVLKHFTERSLKLIKSKHCCITDENTQYNRADHIVPHDGDLHNRTHDEQCRHRYDHRNDHRDDVRGSLGEQALDNFHDDVGHKDQHRHDGQQDAAVLKQIAD